MTDERHEAEDITPASYADLAALAKSLSDEDAHLDEPPPELWQRIEERIVLTDVVPRPPEPAPQPTAPASIADARSQRKRARPVRGLPVAAAIVLIAIVGAVVVARRDDDEPTAIASVPLVNDGLDPRGAGSHGEATLVRLDDGTYALDVDVEDLPAESGDFFELWVIDPNVEGMVSLGPVRGSGRFDLPPSIDPVAFPIVDISLEPTDGVPTHSGDSILRGVLQT